MNIYDNGEFFNAYAQMPRSSCGLEAAGEWHQLKSMLPDMNGKRVLDLGCGYGWHCAYASDNGAESVTGIDSSEKMLRIANARNSRSNIKYHNCPVEEYSYPPEAFDAVISNLVLHYIEDIEALYGKVRRTLVSGGAFVFNIEHPTFTAGIGQKWILDETGAPLYWPVDDYYYPGIRTTDFLGHEVRKYHHTLTQILGGLLKAGFTISHIEEATPSEDMMDIPGMRDEMRRPMMLLVKAIK